MRRPRVEIGKERGVNTYTVIWQASETLLRNGIEVERGATYQFMGSIVFTAFTLEAYLNYAGEKLYDCWKDEHESLGPNEKLKLITEKLGMEVDWGKLPFQAAEDLLSGQKTPGF